MNKKINDFIQSGISEFNKKNFIKAEKIFIEILREYPEGIMVYTYLIPILIYQNKYNEAANYSQKLFNLNKKSEIGLVYLGIINFKLSNFEKSLNNLNDALKINSKSVDALINIGATLHKLERNSEALASVQKAIGFNNKNSIAYHTLGSIYESEAKFNDAIVSFKKAILINPNDYESIHGLSLIQLSKKNYSAGWANYEARWLRGNMKFRYPDIKKLVSLKGIENKKILIWHEQGFGDTIQFSRYVSLLIKLKAIVVFEVQQQLLSFLKDQIDCDVIEKAESKDFDFQSPLLSVPKLFSIDGNDIPSPRPYFKCNRERYLYWKSLLFLSKEKINIGIAISGNPNHYREEKRRIHLESFLPLMKLCKIFIIQKELNQNDLIFSEQNEEIIFLGKDKNWTDFKDTSAIVENMDLIITIDTSLVHLAASMNKETILLLSKPSDWRWSENNKTLPNWYDSLTVIRQNEKNSWQYPLKEILRILEKK